MQARLFHHLHQSAAVIHRAFKPRLLSSTANERPVADEPQTVPHFDFQEEPLGLPASEGFGYFQGGPGLALGPNSRFKLQAKLGFGTTSNVWLAKDSTNNKHVAIKILKGYATQLNHEHKLRELEVLQRLSSATANADNDHCTKLLAQFIHPGIEDDGEHLCLVTELSGSDVQATQENLQGKHIPVGTVKRILRHVLLGIVHLHKCGIAHTDIKPDNIMIDLEPHWTTEAIDAWVRDNPPRTWPPERSLNKMVSVLADYSNAQFVDDQTTDDITPLGLRPPEVVLGGAWNESVDIWTFGCMVFTVLTNRPLFLPMTSAEHDASEVDVLLYQMISFCGEFFKESLLRRCSQSLEYFRLDCKLKKFEKYGHKPFQKCIQDTGYILSPEDTEGVTDLMTKCLRIDPTDRATAQELLEHPWLKA